MAQGFSSGITDPFTHSSPMEIYLNLVDPD